MGTGPCLEGFQSGHFSVSKKWYFSVISFTSPSHAQFKENNFLLFKEIFHL